MSTSSAAPPRAPGHTQQIVPNTISRMPFTVKQEFRAPNLLAVKPEPVDVPLFSGSNNGPFPNLQPQLQLQQYVGPTTSNDQKPLPFERKNSAKPVWKLYDTAVDIVYSPEAALEQGLAMVDVVKKSVSTLHVGSKMRQEVWLRDIKRMESTGAHKTMIALCGATGAGKSSVINALLDDNIVPTSGMRACTATVTEISYHNRRTIDADIDFLSTEQWKSELEVLLQDLQDDEGHLKRVSDMRNDAGVAWHKVHAVYPKLTGEQLIRMSAEEIIATDPKIAKILDSTKHLSCQNSREFSKEINKYIDSKDQKRGDKKDKEHSKKKKKDLEEPALWPLIRQVKVRVKANALSTGAVLCDLPGVADANAARSSIAKDYMKLANCIWVLAPIHRAVDDKTARDLLGDAFKTQLLMDGSYDDSTVTFVATKADDIAASEIINALHLHDEPELEAFEDDIEAFAKAAKAAKKEKEKFVKELDAADKQLQRHKSILAELQEHLHCVKVDRKFVPRLTAKQKRTYGDNPKKRKSMNDGRKSHTKRRKSDPIDDSDEESGGSKSDASISVPGEGSFIATSECETDELGSDEDMSSSSEESSRKKKKSKASKKSKSSRSSRSKSKSKKRKSHVSDSSSESSGSEDDSEEYESDDSDSHKKKSKKSSKHKRKNSRYDSDDEEAGSDVESADEDEDEETEESLESKISAKTAEIKELRAKIQELKKNKSEAGESASQAKKNLESAQRQKNAWCALKRAEFSRDVLKQDFRTGLRELDEAAAIERDAASFDPSEALRDYDAIDLPVFCVSARDYARIHQMNKGDGGPSTFADDEQTEVPDLRKWCKKLTVTSRQRTAKSFLETIRVFAQSILSYVDGLEGISEVERESMRRKWQTPEESSSDEEDDPYAWIGKPWNEDGLLNQRAKSPPRDATGNLIGIMPRLRDEFEGLIDDTREHLKDKFKEGLEAKCDEGAEIAAKSALEISDKFAQEIHWQTYRATLRREGAFRQDLNELLCNPLTKNIASSWSKVFEANLFSSLDGKALSAINKLLREVENSTRNPGLKERCKSQGELAIEEAKVELSKLVNVVEQSLQSQQKDISRCIAPTVRAALREGYLDAALERGRGSVARQKLYHLPKNVLYPTNFLKQMTFRKFLDGVRGDAFEGSTSKIFGLLEVATDNIADQLDNAFEDLAKKMEVNLSVLWEGAKDTPEQQLARAETKKMMRQVMNQVDIWRTAASVHEMSLN